jgi:hypothetical protein
MLTTDSMVLHVRFNGRSEELDLGTLDLHPNVTDAELRAALAKHYDAMPSALEDYVIVREPQAIIVRPVAIYG